MADDADPPRKFYELKPREFERVNPPAAPASTPGAAPDPGITPTADTSKRIDVNEIIRASVPGSGPLLGNNAVSNRANEVHGVLQDNYQRERAAGLYHVEAVPDKKRRRRIRNYFALLALVDIPLVLFAWKVGPGAAIPFVCAIAGAAMFTAVSTWQTWFLRTD